MKKVIVIIITIDIVRSHMPSDSGVGVRIRDKFIARDVRIIDINIYNFRRILIF
jgi:hypothetical protein